MCHDEMAFTRKISSRGRWDSGWAIELQGGFKGGMYHDSFKGLTDEMCNLKVE